MPMVCTWGDTFQSTFNSVKFQQKSVSKIFLRKQNFVLKTNSFN